MHHCVHVCAERDVPRSLDTFPSSDLKRARSFLLASSRCTDENSPIIPSIATAPVVQRRGQRGRGLRAQTCKVLLNEVSPFFQVYEYVVASHKKATKKVRGARGCPGCMGEDQGVPRGARIDMAGGQRLSFYPSNRNLACCAWPHRAPRVLSLPHLCDCRDIDEVCRS
jgi:hypothetical protein